MSAVSRMKIYTHTKKKWKKIKSYSESLCSVIVLKLGGRKRERMQKWYELLKIACCYLFRCAWGHGLAD